MLPIESPERERIKAANRAKARSWRAWHPGVNRDNMRAYRAVNRDKLNADAREVYDSDKKKGTEKARRWRDKVKDDVFTAYGRVCACCGEANTGFLTIDHIHNDGASHRRELNDTSLYAWLRRNGYPKDRFQLLCWNCNQGKRIYGVCPHEKSC